MHRMFRSTTFQMAALAALAVAMTAGRVDAGSIVEYELFGQPGNQVSSSATFAATGATGSALVRGAGLTATAASNGFAASGWNDLSATDYFQLGFTLAAGYSATVDQFILASRSSGTGPGFVEIDASVDGGAFTKVTTLVQDGTNYNNALVNLGLTVHSSLVLRLRVDPTNAASANGGAIGSAGTYRISDYSGDGGQTYAPISLTGTISQTAAVPEPASIAMLSIASLGVLAVRFRFRSAR